MWIDGWYPLSRNDSLPPPFGCGLSPDRGALFECVCKDAEEAHRLCEDWMMRQERY